ncbi:MAG: PucR family transcriptional regulator [Lachnospiraceae bacterium]|nr:PucR family transcriptional regulator [Lachnospiraceae bacterium]
MKLSMWILANWLKDYHPTANIPGNEFAIESVRLFSNEPPSNDHTVYIGRLSDLFYTGSDQVICTHHNDILILETTDLEEVLNCVLNALERYQGWGTRMLELLASNAMLQELFDTTSSLLPEPIFLMDVSQRFLAHMPLFARGEVDPVWDDMVAFGSPDIDFLVTVNQAFPERFAKRELYVLEAGLFPHRCYNQNFFFQDKWVGTAVQIERTPGTSRGCLDTFSLFCGFLQRWFDIHIQEEQSVLLDYLLLSVITDPDTSQEELVRLLQLQGWRETDSLVFLKLDTPFQPFSLNQHLCRSLNLQFDFLYAIQAELSLCVLANLQRCPLAELLDRLGPWLRSNRCYGIQGRLFTMRDSLYDQYQYAVLTSQYCGQEPGRLYCGDEFALPYMLKRLQGNLLPQIIHPALARLKAYDQEHHAEFYPTLKAYLQNERSLVRTADALGLHRNSLLYRVRRLEELVEADLTDPMVRLHILLSYELAP